MSTTNGYDGYVDPQSSPPPSPPPPRVGISPRTGREYGAPIPHWTKCKNYNPELHRAAILMRTAMDARKLSTKAVTAQLEPKCTVGAMHGWLGARNRMGKEHRECIGRILDIDPNLLLPEHETKEERASRMVADRVRYTVFAKRGNPQPEPAPAPQAEPQATAQWRWPARPAPQPSPQAQAKHAATTALDDELEYSFNQVTGMAELRAVLRWADIDLRPLFELIRDERMKHVVW